MYVIADLVIWIVVIKDNGKEGDDKGRSLNIDKKNSWYTPVNIIACVAVGIYAIIRSSSL